MMLAAVDASGLAGSMGLIKQGVLLFFSVLFALVFLRLIFSRSDRYKKAALIPLNDQEIVTPREGLGHADQAEKIHG